MYRSIYTRFRANKIVFSLSVSLQLLIINTLPAYIMAVNYSQEEATCKVKQKTLFIIDIGTVFFFIANAHSQGFKLALLANTLISTE